MKIEVRCCCQADKLLGWLTVPDDVCTGQIVSFAVPPAHVVMQASSCPEYSLPETVDLPVSMLNELTMTTGELLDEEHVTRHTHTHLALKSDDTPIDVLRRIHCFVENHGER